jgi:hypothetical protein
MSTMTDATIKRIDEIADKLDKVISVIDGIEARMATKDDLQRLEIKLGRRMDEYQGINTEHHLETRKMIGDLTGKFDNLREGLAHAAGL